MKSNKALKNKAIFIFLLILGNALMAILTFSEEPEEFTATTTTVKRPGYVRLRIAGTLKAELNANSPVTLVGLKSSNVIKHVFVIKRYKRELSPQDFIQKKNQEHFLVTAPKEQAMKMLTEESFVIYPHGINVAQPQRKRSYEVIY